MTTLQQLPESTVALRNEYEISCPFDIGDEIVTITRAVTDSPALLIKKRVVSQIVIGGTTKVITDDGFQFTPEQCYSYDKLANAYIAELGHMFDELLARL